MNNKITRIFALASISLLSLTLGACGRENNDPVSKPKIDYGNIRSTPLDTILSQEELLYSDLQSKISKKHSFVLVLYSNDYCSCWIDFQPILTEYINEKNASVEYMNVREFQKQEDNFGLYLARDEMPSVVLFSNGKVYKQIVYGRDGGSYFKNKKVFYGFMEENAIEPDMYYIDKNTLQSYMDENKEFVLYVAKTGCNDCGNVEKDFLHKWHQEYNGQQDAYIFDIAAYVNTDDYQNIKDWVGLSTVNNPVLGYSTGMVPTFQKRRGSVIEDMITTNNDSFETIEGKNILNSYFTSERVSNMKFLKGETQIKTILDKMELSNDDLTHYVNEEKGYDFWYIGADFYAKYHYPLLDKFLTSYLK